MRSREAALAFDMGALANVKHEWKCFKDDRPGERFSNHRDRMQHRSRSHSLIAIVLGVFLLAGGFVFLFIPGPGLPLIVFGLALVGSHNKRLAHLLDRAEPKLHAAGHAIKRRWRRMSTGAKATVIASIAALASAGILTMYKVAVAANLIG